VDTSKNKRSFKRVLQDTLRYFSKAHNLILLVFGIVITLAIAFPLITNILDTVKVHPGTYEGDEGLNNGTIFSNFNILFNSELSKSFFWIPFGNTMIVSVLSCVFAIGFGGIVAYLVTRTNMKCKKFIIIVFIFTYIMPQWTLALVWQNLFNSSAVTGGSDRIFATLFGINMPLWWCSGIFPTSLVLGLHYAPFAYILIGGILRNMDSNLEEAATILNAPRSHIFGKITIPMIYPAILSTFLLVFCSAMGSYPVPHFLKLSTLATTYKELNINLPAGSSIISLILMAFGIGILVLNQYAFTGRKQYTTISGKSGQISMVNLKVFKYIIAVILVVVVFMTSIYPLFSFTFETFLQNPGDYSEFTLKWWTTSSVAGESGMFSQLGILYNKGLWKSIGGSLLVSFICAILAGSIGFLIGYAVSKQRKNKFANYVNNISFLPYLVPSLALGASYFVLGSQLGIYKTYLLFIIVGTIKYIPFASRSSLTAMMQLSGEIEEAAVILQVPWWKRMVKVIIPIQKVAIISGFLLPFITCIRELTLFMMLGSYDMIATTTLAYYDEMGLYALSSGINVVIIIIVLSTNGLVGKLTGASIDKGVGG
jgi:iron(III) transport system permease protein